MIDKDAIDALSRAQAIQAANSAVLLAMNNPAAGGMLALPNDWTTHDFEKLLDCRRRARGQMSTRVLQDFASYVSAHREDGASVFVDPKAMKAFAVLNLGTPAKPGHADNLAIYEPQRTAAFASLLQLVQQPRSQTVLAEWLEDWGDFVSCRNGETVIATKHAIAAVRKVTIESVSRTESTQEQLSASRSAFDAVKAASGDQPLPSHITFGCMPHEGLQLRGFVVRVSIHTDGKAPTFGLRIAKFEEHEEQMAEELAQRVRQAVDAAPVFIGAYAPKA